MIEAECHIDAKVMSRCNHTGFSAFADKRSLWGDSEYRQEESEDKILRAVSTKALCGQSLCCLRNIDARINSKGAGMCS